MYNVVFVHGIIYHYYLTSGLRYKFLILGTYHPDTLYLRQQGCEDPWLFFQVRRGSQTKEFGKPSFRVNQG
jgi:hypothetical protein